MDRCNTALSITSHTYCSCLLGIMTAIALPFTCMILLAIGKHIDALARHRASAVRIACTPIRLRESTMVGCLLHRT